VNAERRGRKRWFLLPLLIMIPVVLWGLFELVAAERERHNRWACVGNLKNAFGCALHLYSTDFGEAFPPTIGHLYPDYVSDGRGFLCPSAGKATALEDDPRFSLDRHWHVKDYTPAMFGDTHNDYVYVSGLKATDPANYVLAFDDEWNHGGDGVHAVFIGSNVEWTHDIKALHEQLAKQEKELAAEGRKMKLLRPAWSSWPEPPPELAGRPLRLRHRIAVAVGMMAAIAVALALVVRTVWRGRKRAAEPDQEEA
jgi:hypothetical protein